MNEGPIEGLKNRKAKLEQAVQVERFSLFEKFRWQVLSFEDCGKAALKE